MDNDFMQKLVTIRRELGFPFYVTSGYRCPDHPAEKKKTTTGGPHTQGKAVDIAITGANAVNFLESCLRHGMTGFGIQQRGSQTRFIHVDTLDKRIWSY